MVNAKYFADAAVIASLALCLAALVMLTRSAVQEGQRAAHVPARAKCERVFVHRDAGPASSGSIMVPRGVAVATGKSVNGRVAVVVGGLAGTVTVDLPDADAAYFAESVAAMNACVDAPS